MDEPLWKQCASWLCRLSVLPSNHKITWPDATIQDLAYTLRDGVLLCHVASTLNPSSVDMRAVNQRPQSARFLCLKNIRIFLHACLSIFEVKETNLFQPSMLYDYTDFARVLHTLSKLSHSSNTTLKVDGFPTRATTNAPSTHGASGHSLSGHGVDLGEEEEQIYRTLEDIDEDKYEKFYYAHHGDESRYAQQGNHYYRQFESEDKEDIYEDLCSLKNSQKRSQGDWNFQPKEKRDYCIKELVETELNYVDVLNMLRKHFIKDIKVMKDGDKQVIFMNIKELGEIHAAFYQDVRESVTGKSRKRIGEIFLEFKERFLRYGDFCSQLPKAVELLDCLLNKDEAVREEITKCEFNANEGRFRLRDLLLVPMQRILKYHLILRELMSNTVSTHDDYRTIASAYAAMLDVADFINEVKRDSEQLHIIREIQNSITDWNMPAGVELTDYGRLLKDSELKVQCHDVNAAHGGGKTKLRYVFVFDKVLLMCKTTRGDHYSFKDSLRLSDYRVQDVPAGQPAAGKRSTMGRVSSMNPMNSMGEAARWAFAFNLVHVDNSNAYTMYARTKEDMDKWTQAINDALSHVNPPTTVHAPSMETFTKPTNCAYCHKLLKGLFYQGYRCQKCKKAMHRECILLLSQCGTSQPPALPPRPPSMQLPSRDSMNNRFSTCSLEDDEPSSLERQSSLMSLPPPTIPAPILNQNELSDDANPDYINTRMEDHSWFVGPMDRDSAVKRLSAYPVQTFLVRCRVGNNGEVLGHALSLKLMDDVKHMKICSTVSANGNGNETTLFYLSDSRKFRSIVELVAHYGRNSLRESFSGLDASLKLSIGELVIMEALFDFAPDPKDSNMLPMKTGDRVVVVDKTGDSRGWWKACRNVRTGYIPKDFVGPVTPSENENGGDDHETLHSSHGENPPLTPTKADIEATI